MTIATRPSPTSSRETEVELAREHAGEWAALDDEGNVIAISRSSVEAYEQARARGVDTPTMYLVPESETGSFYY